MRVEILKTKVSADGVLFPGDVRDLPDEIAKELIKSGYAREINPQHIHTPETITHKPERRKRGRHKDK